MALWVAWFVMHTPATIELFPVGVAGPVLLALLWAMLLWGTRGVGRQSRVRVGVVGGLTAGALCLTVLGSKLTEPLGDQGVRGSAAPVAEGLRAGAAWAAPGFVALCAALGLGAGAAGRVVWGAGWVDGPAQARRWVHRMAVVTLVAVVPLLLLGGLVTSSGAGLAVPDWPGTYGANMFLYPIALMADPRIFLEHTHRLYGALVGLTVLGLAVMSTAHARRGVAVAAWALFVAVAWQGYVGGRRVLEASEEVTKAGQWLGVLHGMQAQVFFAGLAAFTAALGLGVLRAGGGEGAGGATGPGAMDAGVTIRRPLWRPDALSALALGALLLQLMTGAMYRHLRAPHALWAHVGFSIVVVVLAAVAGMRCRYWAGPTGARAGDSQGGNGTAAEAGVGGAGGRLRVPGWAWDRLGVLIVASAVVQFVLGWVSLLVVTTAEPAELVIPVATELRDAPPIAVARSVIRTVHQANGAVLLGGIGWLLVWAGVERAARRQQEQPTARPHHAV
ncbi:MAG: hypothetical protein C0513_05150 [Isosphaera sp.]|nr:hypothetical protein [Isosphaera sp.]